MREGVVVFGNFTKIHPRTSDLYAHQSSTYAPDLIFYKNFFKNYAKICVKTLIFVLLCVYLGVLYTNGGLYIIIHINDYKLIFYVNILF